MVQFDDEFKVFCVINDNNFKSRLPSALDPRLEKETKNELCPPRFKILETNLVNI